MDVNRLQQDLRDAARFAEIIGTEVGSGQDLREIADEIAGEIGLLARMAKGLEHLVRLASDDEKDLVIVDIEVARIMDAAHALGRRFEARGETVVAKMCEALLSEGLGCCLTGKSPAAQA
jgi:hypothetical protein